MPNPCHWLKLETKNLGQASNLQPQTVNFTLENRFSLCNTAPSEFTWLAARPATAAAAAAWWWWRWLWRILQVWWSEQGILGIMGALVALTRGLSQWEAIQEGRRDWWTASTPRFLPGGRRLVVVDREEAPILEGLLVCTEPPGPSTWELPFSLPLLAEHH